MSKLRLHGTSSGYTDIAPTAAAGNNTLTAPTGTGTLVAQDAAGAIGITSVQATNANFSGTTRITSGISTTLRITTGISTTLQVGGVNVLNSDGVNTSGIVTATNFVPTGVQLSHRNKVINGAMTVLQRLAPFTSTGSEYTMDRWAHESSGSLTFDTTTTRDVSVPVGFRKCLKITPDSTQTPSGTMNGMIQQKIEGGDLQEFQFGTSSAKKITLSFYAKSASQNNNHQYSVQLRKYNDGNDRQFVNKAFTVTSSWQRFTMTFNGDTSENIRNDTATGLQILFHLSTGPDDIAAAVSTFSRTTNSGLYTAVTGQSNFMDNTSNEFYLTGVQLEVGEVATPFEHKSYAEDLRACQRYYWQLQQDNSSSANYIGSVIAYGSNYNMMIIHHPVPMRTAVTALVTSGTAADYQLWGNGTVSDLSSVPALRTTCGVEQTSIDMTFNLSAGDSRIARIKGSTTAFLGFYAEL